MKTTRDLALIGLYTALLIGAQLALSFISGVEIITLLLAVFAFCFGTWKSLMLSTAFSLLRCLVFGFFPNVLILYLIYYNLFSLAVSLLARGLRGCTGLKTLIIVTLMVGILTVCFTLLDNVITPVYYGYSLEATKAYFVASLSTLIPHVVCAVASIIIGFIPLVKLVRRIIK